MNKSELIDAVAAKAGTTKSEAADVIAAFEEVVTEALRRGEKVQLSGFLTFETTRRAARTGRNPRTGETVQIPAATVPKVKIGKTLKDAVGG